MSKIYFCTNCKKVFEGEKPCACQEALVKEMKKGTPVNIVGTKLKGKVYKLRADGLDVVVIHNKVKEIRSYPLEEVRKIL